MSSHGATGVVARVHLWEHGVGTVTEDPAGEVTFEYDDAFRESGLAISPFHLPLDLKGSVRFPELRRSQTFQGLPGVLADALPDRFGTAVIRRYFDQRGETSRGFSPVARLRYVGDRAMGALEVKPALTLTPSAGEHITLDVSELITEARSVIEGPPDAAIPSISRIGTSAGGMRPKAIILWNRATDEIRSSGALPMPGDEPWLIKFDGVRPAGDDGTVRATGPGTADGGPQPLMRIEHAYSELARRAGLDVPETRLLHERGYAHFMSRRFDRVHGGRVHQHTLGGVLHLDYQRPAVCSYEQYLRTVRDLGLDERSLDEAFRRAVFNVAAVNQDDHVKNFSFLMDRSGAWRLSPAYDLTFSRGHGWTRYHQMTIRGKRDGITRADLESLADEFGIAHSGAGIIDAVMDALGDWEDVAGAVDVPGPVIQSIREELRRRGLARDPAPAGARGTTSDHSGAIDDS